jgi:regulator of protease activity HflC (stomatin/prohibitin superfamily)
MKTNNVSVFDNKFANNLQTLNATTIGAKAEIKTAKSSPMYYVNALNKLARKNELVNATNLHELGAKVRYAAILLGKEVPTSAPFNLYVFTKDFKGRVCYRKHSVTMPNWGLEIESISAKGFDYLCPVTMSETGFVTAYKYVLAAAAKEADKVARANNREAAKAAKKSAKAAAAALKEEQQQARELFAAGKLTAEEFAKIMIKCA